MFMSVLFMCVCVPICIMLVLPMDYSVASWRNQGHIDLGHDLLQGLYWEIGGDVRLSHYLDCCLVALPLGYSA